MQPFNLVGLLGFLTLIFLIFFLVNLLLERFIVMEKQNKERHIEIMTGLERLTASVTQTALNVSSLTTSVDKLAGIQNPTDAQLNTLADHVDTLNINIVAQQKRVDDFVSPPAPVAVATIGEAS